MTDLYVNDAFSILVISTKKAYSSFLKKVFVFQNFKVQSCHWLSYKKHCRSLKQRAILKIPSDVLKTSQIHLKKDVFFVTSLRRLKNISKRCLLCDIFNIYRRYLKENVYSVTSPRHLCIPHKNGFMWFL